MEQANPQLPPEYPRPYGVADMNFGQVSILNSQLAEQWEMAAGWRVASDDEAVPQFEEAEQDWKALHAEVRQFIRDDPPRATELIRQLASSESVHDRRLVARNIDEVCAVDIGTGLELWNDLLLDDEVEQAAWEAMDRSFRAERYSANDLAHMIQELMESVRYWHGKAKWLKRDLDKVARSRDQG